MTEYIVDIADNPSFGGVLITCGEIVRCRDCEHYMSGSRCNLQDDFNEFHWLDVEPDGFCAWASRKEGGE